VRQRPSVPESYFAEMYERSNDPWHLAERWYESRKYALTLAALPARRYKRAFEPGCSAGVLSALLAERCDALVSWDRRPEAVATAAARLRGFEAADASVGLVPEQWPDGTFDLIVLSELLYYLDADGRARLLKRVLGSLMTHGHLVAVHWRHHVPEYSAEAEEVHGELRARPELVTLVTHEEEDFLLDVYAFAPDEADRQALSVAAAEGLV
jgi:SAM-dependent methyltransferase